MEWYPWDIRGVFLQESRRGWLPEVTGLSLDGQRREKHQPSMERLQSKYLQFWNRRPTNDFTYFSTKFESFIFSQTYINSEVFN